MTTPQGLFNCPFCDVQRDDFENRLIYTNEHGFVIRDGFPITDGHSLVIPKKHVGSFFDLTSDEQAGLHKLVLLVREDLKEKFKIEDLNIGINDGPLAGQTVPHCHIHIIPRREGDVSDPRGGVRWIIPEKADYWS